MRCSIANRIPIGDRAFEAPAGPVRRLPDGRWRRNSAGRSARCTPSWPKMRHACSEGDDAVQPHVPFPVAHLADALRIRQPALVLLEVVDGRAGAQHVAHAMREDRPVDRLGDEVGGADLERALDRLDVVEARHHDHRHPRRRRAACATRRKTSKPSITGMLTSISTRSGSMRAHRLERLPARPRPRRRRIPPRVERRAREPPGAGVVVDDEDAMAGGAHADLLASAARSGRIDSELAARWPAISSGGIGDRAGLALALELAAQLAERECAPTFWLADLKACAMRASSAASSISAAACRPDRCRGASSR